jgi:hypothetical protein
MQAEENNFTHELLWFINQQMEAYASTSGKPLGECPIISDQSTPNHHLATLYRWDENFHDAHLVASWFNAFGITDLSIMQTLYDANNLDDELEENERKWDVYFVVNSQLN